MDEVAPDKASSRLLALMLVGATVLVATVSICVVGRVEPARALAALAFVFLGGYVPGALLVECADEPAPLAWGFVRVVAGLLLSTLAFLLSLVIAAPWFVGPLAVLAAAVARHRYAAISLPPAPIAASVDSTLAVLLATALVSPIVISSALMARGEFPPVFFNVDTPYFLEQVHALVHATTYPPASLGNIGGFQLYHFAIQAMCALIARSTGIAPHHATFLIVLPLLCVAIVSAALLVAAELHRCVPKALAIPLLLVPVPSFWYGFWDTVWPAVREAAVSNTLAPLAALAQYYEMWGAASNVGSNVGAVFITLATLAAIAVAPVRGWRLAVFLAGTGLSVKVPTGVALVSGVVLAQMWQAWSNRRVDAMRPAVAVVLVAGATYLVLFVLPGLPVAFRTQPFALFHLTTLYERAELGGFAMDIVWLLLPVAAVLATRRTDQKPTSARLLILAIAPFIAVNAARSVDIRPGTGTVSRDWLQILFPAPILIHAWVLAVIAQRWPSLGAIRRAVVCLLIAAAAYPAVVVAGRYATVLLSDRENGHEFADNRSIAEALAVIPTKGSLVVTNDLRYPTEQFSRDNRQLQITSLFGHQAFAVNYAYEIFDFSNDRKTLQALLRSEAWSEQIVDAARRYRWTHLLIHKSFPHPRPIPLENVFENDAYAVFRFSAPIDGTQGTSGVNPQLRSTLERSAVSGGREASRRRP